jgi:hypothetical protein
MDWTEPGSDALMPAETLARLTRDALARSRALADDDRRLRRTAGVDRIGGPSEPGNGDPTARLDGEVEY